MASEMPVLPLVGSRIVAPGRRVPSASATRIMLSAARSLIEPVGLRSSSLAHNRTVALGDSLGRPTSGVLPTESASEAYRATVGRSAAGDSRKHDDDVTISGRRAEPAAEPHVLVVDVDVDEAAETIGLDQPLLEPGVAIIDVVDDLEQRRPVALHGLLTTGEGPQDR